jgi:hypothetical protein
MNMSRRSLRFVAMAIVVTLPLLAMSGAASAMAAKGCHKTDTCRSGAGTGTGIGGATPGPMTIQIDPNPLIETSSSDIAVVILVETSPSLAGDTVDIMSSQFDAACSQFTGIAQTGSSAAGSFNLVEETKPLLISLVLDDDGNASVALFGRNCAPGSSIIEASLTVAPYYTALTTLVANPPVVTPPGVFGDPTTSGAVTGGGVETGSSNVYAVFSVETDPVYAEQPVELSMNQLADRCFETNEWVVFPAGSLSVTQTIPGGIVTSVETTIDDDGNAVVIFAGSSCAAGPSVVTADVEAGTHPTYTTTFNVLPPQPTIQDIRRGASRQSLTRG